MRSAAYYPTNSGYMHNLQWLNNRSTGSLAPLLGYCARPVRVGALESRQRLALSKDD